MSMVYCEGCDRQIDTDFDAEHFIHKEMSMAGDSISKAMADYLSTLLDAQMVKPEYHNLIVGKITQLRDGVAPDKLV
jgi:hypothetical protein